MNFQSFIELLQPVLYILTGFLALYFQKSASAQATLSKTTELLSNVKTQAVDYITLAEKKYSDLTKAGNIKFEYVVDRIYSQIPNGFSSVITEEMIAQIVQSTFNEMEKFAVEQLDKKLGNG